MTIYKIIAGAAKRRRADNLMSARFAMTGGEEPDLVLKYSICSPAFDTE